MKGTLKTVSFYHTAYCHVSAHMGTVSVRYVCCAVLTPKHRQRLPEHLHLNHLRETTFNYRSTQNPSKVDV